MTTMVAVYRTADMTTAMAVDVGTGGSNAEVWKAVAGALPEGDELLAVVEGARGTDAFCMVGPGTYVTLAPPAPVSYEAHAANLHNDAGLTTAQRNAKEAAIAEAAAAAAKPAKKASAKKTKGA